MECAHADDHEPRAVVLCPSYPYPPVSGGVKRALRLLECMQRAGLRVTVVSDDAPEASAVSAVGANGIQTNLVTGPEPPGLRRFEQHLTRRPAPRSRALTRELSRSRGVTQLEGLNATAHLGRRWGGQLVFSTQNVEGDIARAAQTRERRLTVEGQRRRYHAHRVTRQEQAVARRADVVICVSDADAAAFAPYARRIVTAPNGVDAAFFAAADPMPDNEDVLFFGQFTYAANHEGLMRFLHEGWPALAEHRPAARLLIAGQGSDTLDLAHVARADRIRRLGLVPDVSQTLAACRLSIVPIWSGGGTRLKVLEALAARRPVVGTALGVSGVGFHPGEHGLVAESPADLAAATAALLDDAARLDAMADAGRALARRFEWTVALAPAEAMYRELASGAAVEP